MHLVFYHENTSVKSDSQQFYKQPSCCFYPACSIRKIENPASQKLQIFYLSSKHKTILCLLCSRRTNFTDFLHNAIFSLILRICALYFAGLQSSLTHFSGTMSILHPLLFSTFPLFLYLCCCCRWGLSNIVAVC